MRQAVPKPGQGVMEPMVKLSTPQTQQGKNISFDVSLSSKSGLVTGVLGQIRKKPVALIANGVIRQKNQADGIPHASLRDNHQTLRPPIIGFMQFNFGPGHGILTGQRLHLGIYRPVNFPCRNFSLRGPAGNIQANLWSRTVERATHLML
jgi:hypothetical protein